MTLSKQLTGKRVLVYGGGTGLGFACAWAMAEQGASIFLSGRREGVLRKAAEQLSKICRVAFEPGDATVVADIQRVTGKAVAAMEGLDTLVISAGTSGRTSIFDAEPEYFQGIVDHNIRPVFLASRYAVAHLLQAGGGSIIAISSMYGLVGQKERAAYCTAKAGVIGMVRAIALDLADKGVRANAICPGFVETELAVAVAQQEADPEAALRQRRMMHAIPRAGRAEEIGAAAVYLASDVSAFMTGQTMTLDGGYTIR